MHLLLSILLSIGVLLENPLTEQANISVLVRNIDTQETIDSYREENVVPPASVMKLLTTGAALELLGADFRFVTTLETSAPIENGVLKGNLYIKGSCDPSLGLLLGRGRGNGSVPNTTTAFLSKWAKAIADAGIRRIEGSVVADMTLLDGDATNPSWLWEDAGNYYAPGVFGINYLGNSLNIVLKSGEVGSVAEVTRTEPYYPDLQIINHIRCTQITYDGAFVHGLPYSKERYLTGSIPSNLGVFGVRSDMPNPGLLLAQHLLRELSARGITVTEPATYIADYNPLLPERRVLYAHKSDSLGVLIAECNIHSNNLFAEALFRYLGLNYGKPGTIHNACEVVRDFWKRRGVDIGNALIKDGCGLAPQDAISAATLVQLLTYMDGSKNREVWLASLPVSGESGTLRSLLAGTSLQRRVQAKSGTIAGTKNYAGYINRPNGERWVFAILVNSAPCKAKKIQTIIERYLLTL